MMAKENQLRRQFLGKCSAGLIAGSLTLLSKAGIAAIPVNSELRQKLKYQPTPLGSKSCKGCTQFIPGAQATDMGTCKVIVGDPQISPQGYCTAWERRN